MWALGSGAFRLGCQLMYYNLWFSVWEGIVKKYVG
ncbi:unnamed protein product [Brassica rapa subsp. trilocularis]|uniref:(rape) hypothetical protein n=1 Tax=Brassica napus TaxID=3708 RepID=A0A816TJB4_BRANA|nr:unnamed protein product [Brassica napus]